MKIVAHVYVHSAVYTQNPTKKKVLEYLDLESLGMVPDKFRRQVAGEELKLQVNR